MSCTGLAHLLRRPENIAYMTMLRRGTFASE